MHVHTCSYLESGELYKEGGGREGGRGCSVAIAGSLRGVGELVWWDGQQLEHWMWAKLGWINLF